MNQEQIRELFLQDIDCSQVVVGAFAEELGIEEATLRKVSACFGGGMQCGETCGAVTGALMVIGLKYGHCIEGDQEQKVLMMKKVAEFKQLFREKYASDMCRDLLKHDISQPGELEIILDEGLMLTFCPKIVETVISILNQIMR